MLQVYVDNTIVAENDESVHHQLQLRPLVAFEIPSQPCRSVPEAGCPRLTATFLLVEQLFSVLEGACDKPVALPPPTQPW